MSASLHAPHLADERLDDYVDGLLDAPERETARLHLQECARCAARLDELRALLARSAAERRDVAPPAELWPLVVASTVGQARARRTALRAIRAPLVTAAMVLVALSSLSTAWLVTRFSTREASAPPVAAYLREDAELDRALAARDHDHGPIARPRVAELRARLAGADAAVRRATDDEALYRARAERERVLREIRPVLGRGPRPPRPPTPDS